MTSERRFDQDLPDLLAQVAQAPAPEYRDFIVQRTARVRQRPAWTFPERWLPMSAVTSRAAPAARFPVRIVAVVALLLIALIVGAVLFAGSQRRLPAPFGRAEAGQVAYAAAGDIYSADPVTGLKTAIVTGPETDLKPVWSPDGTRLVFERKVIGDNGNGRLFVARDDGRGLVAITTTPQQDLASYEFSPNETEVVYAAGPANASEIWIAKVDGSGARRLDIGMSASEPWFRPPNGDEIVFSGNTGSGATNGIFAVAVATGKVRTIVAPNDGPGAGLLALAPDGSRVAGSVATDLTKANTYRVMVSALDGSGTTILPLPVGATFQDAPVWSNDSTRIALTRGYSTRNQEMTLAIVPADGSTTGIESVRGLTGCCDTVMQWAPDDRTVLVSPEDLNGNLLPQLLLDTTTGVSRPAPYAASGDPAWQRR
jgi:Tol biopolymer transport system component